MSVTRAPRALRRYSGKPPAAMFIQVIGHAAEQVRLSFGVGGGGARVGVGVGGALTVQQGAQAIAIDRHRRHPTAG